MDCSCVIVETPYKTKAWSVKLILKDVKAKFTANI